VTRRLAAALLVGVLALPACSGGDPSDSPAKDSEPGSVSAQSELTYGRAPADDAGITYQPDVVLVGGGADMVRSVSGDSMTWTIDASAPNIGDLEPGKVMFLTGRGVGRVLQLQRHDDVVVVTLGPVDLTDVIYDGDIDISSPIDTSAMSFQAYPDVSGSGDESLREETPESTTTVKPAMWTGGQGMAAAQIDASADEDEPLPPASLGKNLKISFGDYSAQISQAADSKGSELNLKIGYKKDGILLGFDIGAKFVKPTVTANLSFSSGTLTRNELRVDGLKEVSVGLESGSTAGPKGNFKSRVEAVPADLTFPIPASIPLVGAIRYKFTFTTAFSARNATLSATGKLKVDGPIGFSGKDVLVPVVQSVQSPVDNMAGVSVGVNGVVLAVQVKTVLGLGIPAAFAGPFASFTVSYGLTNGSAIGIVKCKQSSIDVVVAGGVGYTLDSKLVSAVNTLIKSLPFPVKVDSEMLSVNKTVVHEVWYKPKIAACG
jgi:hypothetical protein